MSELKRTQLYDVHVEEGATLIDFGGWEMPVQYPTGIIAEHLYTRSCCGIFDVSHMGRFLVCGKDRVAFLQHVLSNNVMALDLYKAQYTIIPDEDGTPIDDAYLYRFEEERFLLVVNAGNREKDWDHLTKEIKAYDCQIENISDQYAAIAVQGPKSKDILCQLSGGEMPTEPVKNSLNKLDLEGHPVMIAKTGYTGEPIGFEVYCKSEDVSWLWKRLIELGAKPIGLGARDTLRMEAGMPLYGHEMGLDPDENKMPIFSVPQANFAVSFSEQKGDYIGREALLKQKNAYREIMNRNYVHMADLPRRVRPIALIDRGVMRAEMPIYKGDKHVGWITSGTMIPYYVPEGEGLETIITENVQKRAIGMCYLDCDILDNEIVEVDIRGKRIKAVIPECHMRSDAPPYTRVIIYGKENEKKPENFSARLSAAVNLLNDAADNHNWRQKKCINLIPSENTPSKAVQRLCSSDPDFRYAEHKKVKSFYDKDIFYYQGTKFIDRVEQLLVEQMRQYLECTEVETRVTSGQMANTAVFSALMDWKNRLDRKRTPQRLGYVLNNHIIKGGHLSAQPMGALHDYIAVDPVTERSAVVNFPICKDNEYKIDVEETKKVIDEYKPELIIFGKSMVLYHEPVAEIRKFVDEQGLQCTIMYDMAHVLGLVGPHFQRPFADGADIVTGSTHKTFFGPQRGVIGTNWKEEDLKYGLWQTIETRVFPGSVSNHHLGTMLGMLMAAYEMNEFKDEYQKAVVENAKSFAQALKSEGLDVAGNPEDGYTETHQVIVNVGYGEGPEIANRLENNNIIVNYQATPDEEGFTASGALRMGVSEMTRAGFGKNEFAELAHLMADCILRNRDITADVEALRARFTEMKYCFEGEEFEKALENLCATIEE